MEHYQSQQEKEADAMDMINKDEELSNKERAEIYNKAETKEREEKQGTNINDNMNGKTEEEILEEKDKELHNNKALENHQMNNLPKNWLKQKWMPQMSHLTRNWTPIQQVDLRNWQEWHDDWLHAAMQEAMGDTTLKTIPDLDNVKWVDCPPL